MSNELVLPKTLAGFVEWLVENHDHEMKDIIYVLGKPHKYQDEYTQYLSEAGLQS
jgi:hypothetical protein